MSGIRATEVEALRMRQVLGHFPSGVTVVTGSDGGGPAGFACQSFHALSLDPPLVCFCVGRSSTTWPRIRASGRFAVNILGVGHEQLSRAFARSGGDKFDGVDWSPSPLGSPLLAEAVAWVDCRIGDVYAGGDHEIVVGAVTALEASGGEPLVFFRGEYRGLA
ncbi:MAG TPA: flavin reductase family protein [Asanoa sp.]|nr:flavin reductase family protein [Asanoa sp.]